ncbi:hypothetical protein PtA15_1A328 [Puccinia triticina]|uniref:Uncharacterized protein n=1 Tax=Puccinia triticina TaxID=208348 RepID=A0ABY7CAT7_9BASI|nr:uncharacterized protein PtA15_1A328 [Puccinia triticina]WAQ80990.1 hypothetical protein PtA15_1A328 [Puccinia triticina]
MLACSFSFVFLILALLQASTLQGYRLDPRNLSSAAASLGGTSAGEVEFATIVQGWSAVPWAFSKCRSTFESRPAAKLATQAITTLESSIKIVVAQHSTCKLCRSLGTQSTYYVEFEQIIRQIFLSWQSVLLDGSQKYEQEWKTSIGLGFKTFDTFLTTVYNMCIFLQIDLSLIFKSIHLNYQLFNEVGLNLVQILKLNIGVSATGQSPQGGIQSSTANGKQPLPKLPNTPASSSGTAPANSTLPRGSLQSATSSQNQPLTNAASTPAPAPGTAPANSTLPHGSLQSATSSQNQPPANAASTRAPAPGAPASNTRSSPAGVSPGANTNLGQAASSRPGGQGLSVIVQAWSGLPIAFGKVKTMFDQKVPASVALQAVGTLHATVQSAISRFGTCKSCTSLNASDASYTAFQRIIREIFTAWQSLLLTGEQQYKAQWSGSFKAEFAKFDQFLVAVYDISTSIKLDLRSLFVALHLNVEVFISAGLNLSARLNIPQLSGFIGSRLQGGSTPVAGGVTPISGVASTGVTPTSGVASPGLKGVHPVNAQVTPGAGTLDTGASGLGMVNSPGEKGLSLIVQGWSTLPKAFADLQAAFERRVSVSAAVQAVASLHATIQASMSRYGTCDSCAGLAASSPSSVKFRDLIAQIFTSWQNVLEVGQRTYQLQWKSSVGLEFKKFDSFWLAIKNLSASVRLNLGALLSSIHLKASAFADVGIDVGAGLQISAGAGSDPQAMQPSTSKMPAHDISALVYGWAALPSAFLKCQSTLEGHASFSVAFQAIASLRATLQSTISTYGSCNSCNTPYPQSALAVHFRGIISQIFLSWQRIISIGRANYAAQWLILSRQFKQFSLFLSSVKDICSSLKINLGKLFQEININANLFTDVGLNLHAHLDLNIGGQIGGGRCTGNFLNLGFSNCLFGGFHGI